MTNYGLTPDEKQTGLREYNHALFQNMAVPLTSIWEINPITGAVCVMRDNLFPENTGMELPYEEQIRNLCDYIYADDKKSFLRHMSSGMLSTLRLEKSFNCRVQTEDGVVHNFCFVLTPAFSDAGETERIYFSALNLNEDMISMNRELARKSRALSTDGQMLSDDNSALTGKGRSLSGNVSASRKDKISKHQSPAAYIVLGVLTIILLIGVIYGIFTIRQKVYLENSNNLQHVVAKAGVNIDTVMDNKWAEADYFAGALTGREYADKDSLFRELSFINTLTYDTNGTVVLIDKNAVAYMINANALTKTEENTDDKIAEQFKWTNRGSLTGDKHELWVTQLPALNDRETKLTYTVRLAEPITVEDLTITHISLICDMKVLDDFLAMRDYGGECVTYIIRSTGGNVYRQTDSDSELAGIFNVLSAMEQCVYGYGTSYEMLSDDIAAGRSGSVYANVKGRDVYIAYQKLEALDWYAVVMVPDEHVGTQTNTFVRFLIGIIIVFAAGVMGLIIALFIVQNRERKKQELTNMNALRKATLQMSRAAEIEHSANEAKTRFLSSMSHDIRTPMNAIVGLTMLATKRIDDTEYVKECLEKITNAGNHLLSLINDVLDISKVESGSMTLNIADFSLHDVVNNLTDIVRSQADVKHQTLTINTDEISIAGLMGDELRISQIFLNIAANAVKYTPEGGKIDITFAEKPVTGDDDSVLLIYTVTDNGVGMSEEFQKNMYSAFSRETDHRVNKVLGTGLGLAICKQMTDLMDGEIDCVSRVGEGTTFIVTLELKKSAEQSVTAEAANDGESIISTSGKMRILVAEDNDLNWEIVSELLADYDVISDRAENGRICVDMMEAAEDNYYCMVLMDVQMPVMNGREASMELRGSNKPWVRDIPIVAMTADAFAEDIKACMDAGMNAHLSKPVNMTKLLETIEKYCRDHVT